jgi:hypothetical protein
MMPIGELMAQWQSAAASDTRLQEIGRHCEMELLIQVDEDPWFLSIDSGCLVNVDQGPLHMRSSDIAIRGPHATWEKFFSPIPPRQFHDLFAMSSYSHIEVQGNQHLLREHLEFLKALLALPRSFAHTEQAS